MASKKEDNLTKEKLLAEIERLGKELKKRKKYGLVWEEKPEEVVEMCKEKLPILKEAKGKEILTEPDKPAHLLIEGDNYHALSVLNYTHAKKVDVICIDPPYNTGEDEFKFNDNYVTEEDGYRHSKWLSFMGKRLKLSKYLLKETGVIIVHIDEHELDRLYLLMSEIFGPSNDLGRIIWDKRNPKGDSKGVSILHETILCFAKNKTEFLKLKGVLERAKPNAMTILNKAKQLYSKIGKNEIPDGLIEALKSFNNYVKPVLDQFRIEYDLELINKEFQSWIDKQDFSGGEKAYKFIDKNGDVYRQVSMAWPNKNKAPDDYFIPLMHPITKKPCPVPKRGWRNPPPTMKYLLDRGKILFGKDHATQPTRKYLLKENMYENVPSILSYGSSDDNFFDEVGLEFQYMKPVDVAKYLIKSIHPTPKIIIDFFAGSGTVGHAVLNLNKEDEGDRQFILCTNNENNICTDVCYPRIEKVISGYKNTKGEKVEGLGGNLKYFKTDFVDAEPTDKNKKKLTEQATEMLCIKEGAFETVLEQKKFKIYKNNRHYTGIIFDQLAIPDFKKAIKDIKGKFSVYVFSLGDDTFDEEFEDIKQKVRLSPIPEAILRVYRRIFR